MKGQNLAIFIRLSYKRISHKQLCHQFSDANAHPLKRSNKKNQVFNTSTK